MPRFNFTARNIWEIKDNRDTKIIRDNKNIQKSNVRDIQDIGDSEEIKDNKDIKYIGSAIEG